MPFFVLKKEKMAYFSKTKLHIYQWFEDISGIFLHVEVKGAVPKGIAFFAS